MKKQFARDLKNMIDKEVQREREEKKNQEKVILK